MNIPYEKFGLEYVAGRRVKHLHNPGRLRNQCGMFMLQLVVNPNSDVPLCKRCIKTVKIVKVLRKRIAVYKGVDGIVSRPEVERQV